MKYGIPYKAARLLKISLAAAVALPERWEASTTGSLFVQEKGSMWRPSCRSAAQLLSF